MLTLDNIVKIYAPRRTVLRGVSWQVLRGTCTAVLGGNGAGKTTLLRIAAGLSRATRGTVTSSVQPVYFGEADYLYGALTVHDNLHMVAGCMGNVAQIDATMTQWQLHDLANQTVATLSRGLRRRVGYARTWLAARGCVLLDEPFVGLDADGITLVQTAIRSACNAGTAVVTATQSSEHVQMLAPSFTHLTQGMLQGGAS